MHQVLLCCNMLGLVDIVDELAAVNLLAEDEMLEGFNIQCES
jgi:hypothetical protein